MKTPFDVARSTLHAAVVIMVSAVSAVEGCSSDTIAPPPPSVRSQPVAELRQVRVSGTVTDQDAFPVSGVKVSVYRSSPNGRSISTLTDDTGFYSVSLLSAEDIFAHVEKEGYRSAWVSRGIAAGSSFAWDLRIYRMP